MNSQRYQSLRVNKRITTNLHFVGHGKNHFIDGHIKSLSQQGALITVTKNQIENSEKIKIVVLSEDGHVLCRLQGTVKMGLKNESKVQSFIIIFENEIKEELTKYTEKEF